MQHSAAWCSKTLFLNGSYKQPTPLCLWEALPTGFQEGSTAAKSAAEVVCKAAPFAVGWRVQLGVVKL